MYKDFKFEDLKNIQEEIIRICKIKDDDKAIVEAFHFQRYYTRAIKNNLCTTGYTAIMTALKNIRFFMGNENSEIAGRIDFLWGNIPY